MLIISRTIDSLSGFTNKKLQMFSFISVFLDFEDVVSPRASLMVLRWVIRSTGPLSSNFATGVGMFVRNANSETIEAVIIPKNIEVCGQLEKV